MCAMVKDPSVFEVLAWLERELGPGAFQIVDHWEGLLFAIGVATADDPGHLVYFELSNEVPGRFFYECELPRPASEDEMPYEVIETAHDVDVREDRKSVV